ncbi:hypothetical protein [Azospirillum sp. TSO5]|uniref:hypothetical protein n=1 Tax=Azospirillum sp. TSO5 TaxID=716760 RepID=UPI000D6482F5|nr:hypothetical protein [Azospirillum sp. TSO5]
MEKQNEPMAENDTDALNAEADRLLSVHEFGKFKGRERYYGTACRVILAGLLEIHAEASNPVTESVATARKFARDRQGLVAFLSKGTGWLVGLAVYRLGVYTTEEDYPVVMDTILRQVAVPA